MQKKKPSPVPAPLSVTPIAGEIFRMRVESRSRPGQTHFVDLEEYGWNGQCDCERFRYSFEASLCAGQPACEAFRCAHIRRARSWFLDEVLPKIAKQLKLM
jgi:hypothetical protein